MGYFDGLVEANFKTTEAGETVFFPYTISGEGYILTEEKEKEIKQFVKRYHIISIISIILAAILGNQVGVEYLPFLLLLVFIPYYRIKIKQKLVNQRTTDQTQTIKERIENMAEKAGSLTSILILIASLGMTAGSLFCLISGEARLVGIFGVLFFGICLVKSIFLVKYALELN